MKLARIVPAPRTGIEWYAVEVFGQDAWRTCTYELGKDAAQAYADELAARKLLFTDSREQEMVVTYDYRHDETEVEPLARGNRNVVLHGIVPLERLEATLEKNRPQ